MIVGLANHTILVRKDGTEVAIDDSGAPIKDPNGNITGVVLVFRDITERKQTEAIMAQLASFPELNPSPVVEVDLKGQVLYANPAAQRLFPDLRERGLSHQWLSEFNLLRRSFESGQTRSYVRDVMVGERFYQQNAYYVEGVQSIRIYGIDITERKRVEETLRESEERFRALAENIPDLITRFDRNLRLVYANPAVLRRTGLPGEKLVGRTASEYGTSPTAAASWEKAAREVLESGESQRYEHINQWQGETRVFDTQIVPERDADSAVRAVIAIAHDITESKRAEEELQESNEELEVTTEELRQQNDELAKTTRKLEESEAQLRRFYESGLIGVIYWNMDGVITDANDKFLEMVVTPVKIWQPAESIGSI